MSPIVPAKRPRVRPGDPAADLAWQIEQGLQIIAMREFKFHATRKWRADLALVPQRIAIEIEGGFFMAGGGRHSRGAGARADCLKYCELAICGYRLLRVLPEWVKSGQAFTLVERAIKGTR